MKSIMRKATALFLSMLMCISGVPLNALAETMSDVSRAFTLANTAAVLRLVLDPSSAVIPVGGAQVFTPTLEGGASITAADCEWASDNTQVATVVNGEVTGVKVGTAKITCTYGSGSDQVSSIAMVTVTEANYRLVYESNYPDDAQKYTYQNGSTATIGEAVNTLVNETYAPNATATVAADIFTTINYDFVNYLGSDGNTYAPGAEIVMNSNLTLTAQWKKRNNVTAGATDIYVTYRAFTSGANTGTTKNVRVTAMLSETSDDEATVTFITGNNQDTINANRTKFYAWRIGGDVYPFNSQATVTARWDSVRVQTGENSYRWIDAWNVTATPVEDTSLPYTEARAQFFVRKADATGYGTADKYYSVGTGTIDISTFYGTEGTVAGSDNIDGNVGEYIIQAPSAAQIANLMNISLDEASAVRWYVIKDQSDGYHVDGVVYLENVYWKAEFIDSDDNSVKQTLLVEDSEKLNTNDVMDGHVLNTNLRTFKYWSTEPNGAAVDWNNFPIFVEDHQFYAVFTHYAGYTVEYREEGTGKELADPTTHKEQLNTTVYAANLEAPEIANYEVSSRTPASIRIASVDGNYTFTIYYKLKQIEYTVEHYIEVLDQNQANAIYEKVDEETEKVWVQVDTNIDTLIDGWKESLTDADLGYGHWQGDGSGIYRYDYER